MSDSFPAGGRPVELCCVLDECDAYALAELCKRIGYHDCKELAVDERECQHMLAAVVRVRQALQRDGVFVR